MGRELDLVLALREAWKDAPPGDVVVRIHLFGIRHAADLEDMNLKDLVAAAGIPAPYSTEIRKGMRLADHVTIR